MPSILRDTALQVEGGRLVFPRRKVGRSDCSGPCNYMVISLMEGLNRGLAAGKL